MSAHDYYNGRAVMPERKSWWDPFSWWPSDPEDPEPPPQSPSEAEAEYLRNSEVVQEIIAEIEDINRQLEAATGPENASLRRKLREERAFCLRRIQNLLRSWHLGQSRMDRSAG